MHVYSLYISLQLCQCWIILFYMLHHLECVKLLMLHLWSILNDLTWFIDCSYSKEDDGDIIHKTWLKFVFGNLNVCFMWYWVHIRYLIKCCCRLLHCLHLNQSECIHCGSVVTMVFYLWWELAASSFPLEKEPEQRRQKVRMHWERNAWKLYRESVMNIDSCRDAGADIKACFTLSIEMISTAKAKGIIPQGVYVIQSKTVNTL